MKLIGRQLRMQWGNGITVALDWIKSDQEEEALLFDIYEVDGEFFFKLVGEPVSFDKGRDLNWYAQRLHSYKVKPN